MSRWQAEMWNQVGLVSCEHFSQRRAFPASPSTLALHAAGKRDGSAASSPGCVPSGAVRDGFELLLSYLAPKPQPRSQTGCSPAFPLRGACVGRQALPIARKRLEGREEPAFPCSFQRPMAEGLSWDEKEGSDPVPSLSAPPEHALAAS